MTNAQHTPGPWKHHPPTGTVKAADLNLVALVYGDDPECAEDARQIANCHLISAAPDLLSEHTSACDAADAILALMTMEFGRIMVEAPDEEIELTLCGHSVRIPAHKFNRLYNSTTRSSIAKATGESK